MIVYLSVRQLLALHRMQIERFGGAAGLRDRGALEAAVARPQMTFDGEDLYPDIATKAAALMHSLATRHPFVDGNKRVSAHAALLFAYVNGHRPLMTPADLTVTSMSLARGERDVESLTVWFRQRLEAGDGFE